MRCAWVEAHVVARGVEVLGVEEGEADLIARAMDDDVEGLAGAVFEDDLSAVEPTGFMGNAGFFELGVGGRVPW